MSAAAVAGLRRASGQDVGPALTSDSEANTSTVFPNLVKAHSGADIVGGVGGFIGPQAALHSKWTQERKQGYFTSVTKPTIGLAATNVGGAAGVMAVPTIKNLLKKGVGALSRLTSKAALTAAGPDSIGTVPKGITPADTVAGTVDPVDTVEAPVDVPV